MTTAALKRSTIALGALVMLLAGCANPGGGNTAGVGTGDSGFGAMNAGQDCDSEGRLGPTPPPLTPLPADAVLVSATRCLFEMHPVAGDGEWMMRISQKATAGLDGLASALRMPSEKPSRNQDCALVGYLPIIITVTDTQSREIHPEVPREACGAPLKAAVDAIAGVPWVTVDTTKVRQTRSELEVSSGCSGGWKPVIALEAGRSGAQVAKLDTTARPMSVCRFDLDPDPANALSGDKGASYRMGKLASASTLDGAAAGELLAAVASAPPATGACAQAEAPFAVVHPVDGSAPWMTIERGGCYRVLLDAENSLRQLDGALVRRLIG